MSVCTYRVIVFCFFKQTTAYELRISDWSSDLCSSDLGLVCCQIARLDARCAALSPTSAKRLDLPALSLTRVRGTKRESMVAIVSTTAYLGLEARAVEVQCQIATGMPGFAVVGLPANAVAERARKSAV